MPTDWRLTKKAKQIMSLLGSLTGSLMGSGAQGAIANTAQAQIGPGSLTQGQAWNAIQQRNALMSSYPYEVTTEKMLNIIVKQVENGYIIQVGNRQHVASDLKEITDLLTNRVAATLLEWNP
jgi:hypothetical protein